jgi:4-diphosphocytidyl-2-methyl-D-erithritol synthase
MVFERYIKEAVQLVWGGYENIKITTPEDLEIAEVFVKRHQNLGGV